MGSSDGNDSAGRQQQPKAASKGKRIMEESASEGEAEDAYVAPAAAKPQAISSFYQQARQPEEHAGCLASGQQSAAPDVMHPLQAKCC